MQCPKCGGRAHCYATKPTGTLKQRYRRCQSCGHKFSTWEEAESRQLRNYEKSKAPDMFDKNDGKAGG